MRYHDADLQRRPRARVYGSMMLIAALSLTVPSAFSRFFAPEETLREEALLNVGLAVVLLAAYVLYLVFMLKTHPGAFAGEHGTAARTAQAALEPAAARSRACLAASVLAAWMSEMLVGAAEGTGQRSACRRSSSASCSSRSSAARPRAAPAIAMARKNRMDLAVGIALGSCIQIALFVAPVLVLASYVLGAAPARALLQPRRRSARSSWPC